LAQFFWRVLHALDHWLMQARLSLVDAVCSPGAAESGWWNARDLSRPIEQGFFSRSQRPVHGQ